MSAFQADRPGATPGCRTIFSRITYRSRVASIERCSGLLNRRARGSTVAAHQPSLAAQRERGCRAGVPVVQERRRASQSLLLRASARQAISPAWLSSDSSGFVNRRAFAPRECKSLRRPQFPLSIADCQLPIATLQRNPRGRSSIGNRHLAIGNALAPVA